MTCPRRLWTHISHLTNMLGKDDSTIRIEMDRSLRVGGAPVEGFVVVDVNELQKASLKDIHVELKGTIFT